MSLCLFVFAIMCLTGSSLGFVGFGGFDASRHGCFQHCEVKMPSYYDLRDEHWVWIPHPGYCVTERYHRGSKINMDTSCVSVSPDHMDYCNLTQTLVKNTAKYNNLVYRCNVYNATTGTFFYSGVLGPDFVTC